MGGGPPLLLRWGERDGGMWVFEAPLRTPSQISAPACSDRTKRSNDSSPPSFPKTERDSSLTLLVGLTKEASLEYRASRDVVISCYHSFTRDVLRAALYADRAHHVNAANAAREPRWISLQAQAGQVFFFSCAYAIHILGGE